MNNIRLRLLLISLIFCFYANAQQLTSSRIVDAETGEPLPYVSVYVSEGNGSITNMDGEFSVAAEPSDVLRISYAGYETMEIKAGSLPNRIRLKPMENLLNEITVMPVEKILEAVAKRIVTKIGDIFSVTLDNGNKRFFQYIANDLSCLNSSVIRVLRGGVQYRFIPPKGVTTQNGYMNAQ